jgi:hypothetical protein
VTDVVQIQFRLPPFVRDEHSAIDPIWLGYGVATALLEGVAEEIQVPATDLNATIGRSDHSGLPAILLYDAVPGGAGLVAQMEEPEIFRASLEPAQRRVRGDCECGEDASCYGCLRSYRNQFAHTYLKRGPVKRYLEHVLSSGESEDHRHLCNAPLRAAGGRQALRAPRGLTSDGCGVGGAGDLDQRLQEPADAGEARLLVLPVAQIGGLLVGAELQGAGIALSQLDEPRQVGKAVAEQGIRTPVTAVKER